MMKLAAVFLVLTASLYAAYPGAPEPAVIRNRPVYPKNESMPDVDVRKEMTNVDKEIDTLLTSRQDLRNKADAAKKNAQAIMDDAWKRYQEEIDKQQKLESQLQKIDDDVQVLVTKKSKLAEKLKK